MKRTYQGGLAGFWTPRRLRVYPMAVLIGLALGFSIFVLTTQGLTSVLGGRMGGDFPAFYAAGRLAASPHPERLYDPSAQQDAQRDLISGTPNGWIPFAYPPYVATLYRPLAALPFRAAYVLHTLLMAAFCLAAVRLLLRNTETTNRWLFYAAIAMTFYPMLRAILGGQNTALSFFCSAATIAALRRQRPFEAGVWLGVWLFKPQLALMVTLLLVVAGHRRVLGGLAVAACALYAAGAMIGGPGWPVWWYHEGVRPFIAVDFLVNSVNAISLRETALRLDVAYLAIPLVLLAVLLATSAIRYFRLKPDAVVGGATATAVLVSPHALYYDGGLALVGLIGADARRPHPSWILIPWLLSCAQLANALTPVSMTTLILIGAAISAFVPSRESRSTAVASLVPEVRPTSA